MSNVNVEKATAAVQAMYQRAFDVATLAVAADRARRYKEAEMLYEEAFELLQTVASKAKNIDQRNNIAKKASEYVERWAKIQEMLDEQEPERVAKRNENSHYQF